MKKIFSLLLCSVLIISSMSIVFADSGPDISLNESNDVFKKFLSIADIEEIKVINASGEIVENGISKSIESNLLLEEYDKVFEFLELYDLSLSYEVENEVEKTFTTFDIGSEVNRTVYIYHLEYDKNRKFRKEWLTVLDIRYRENRDGTLTALGAPRVNREIDFGDAFSIEISNEYDDYKYKNGNREIEYYGSYRLRARLAFPVQVGGVEIPLGTWHDWGTIYFSHTQK